jgi:hypothetical protein
MDKINVYFKVIDKCTLPILAYLRKCRYPFIKIWVKSDYNIPEEKICNLFRDAQRIDEKSCINHELQCYQWDIKELAVTPEYEDLNHLISRALTQGTEFLCIDSATHCNGQIVLFQDTEHLNEYPKEFLKVKCFNSIDSLLDHLKQIGAFSFTLKDTTRFTKVEEDYFPKGAIVYKEIKTGRYWHLDTFHRTHYEVYDSNMQHYAEASLDGEVDDSKCDKNKSISL